MIDPIRLVVELDCPADHALEVWTARIGTWWRRDRADATEVEVRFVPVERSRTRVEIEHRAWERLGAEGKAWRDRNRGGWSTLLPHYRKAAESAG